MIKQKHARTLMVNIVLFVIAIIYLLPVLLILISSVKTSQDLITNPFGLPKTVTFKYFAQAFGSMHYLRSFLNTALIVVCSVAALLVFTSMAAYAIARKNNRFYNFLYIFFLAGLIVPFQMVMIPLYKVMLGTHLISTYQGMIFFYIGTLSPFSVFLLSGFIKTVPRELEEAAQIDGCGLYRTFFTIVFPMLKPALSTVAILNIFGIWNDFLSPMLYLQKSSMMTLTVQLGSFVGMYNNNWSLIFTGVCMIVAPMAAIFIFAQRFIISGITAGAIKG